MNDKLVHFSGTMLLLVCFFAFINYLDLRKEDNKLREEFYNRNQEKIETNLRLRDKIEHNYEQENALDEYFFNAEFSELDFRYRTGVISKEIYAKERSELLDERLLEIHTSIDKYAEQLEDVEIPTYKMNNELKRYLRYSKGGMIFSGLFLGLIIIYKILKN